MDEQNNTQEATGSDSQDFAAVSAIMETLKNLSDASRARVINTVCTFLNIGQVATKTSVSIGGATSNSFAGASDVPGHFSVDRSLTAKQFMVTKMPKTDVERVACLAFYLTHYMDTPHFKTIDISKLNTDAAQPKFSNAAKAVDNASSNGYLVQAPKGGFKQISAGGEMFVQALPDREAAKISMKNVNPKKTNRSKSKSEKKVDET